MNRVRPSVCPAGCALLHNVASKKCDFRFFVSILQVQNSRNGLEFSGTLNLHNVASHTQ